MSLPAFAKLRRNPFEFRVLREDGWRFSGHPAEFPVIKEVAVTSGRRIIQVDGEFANWSPRMPFGQTSNSPEQTHHDCRPFSGVVVRAPTS